MQKQILSKLLPDQSSYALGVYRFLYFGYLVFYFGFCGPLKILPQFDPSASRPGVFSIFERGFFDPQILFYAYPIWLLCLLLTCLGLFTPVFRFCSFFLGYWILGGSFSNGLISHQDLPHFLVLLVFALSDCGRDFSLDSRFFQRNENKPPWEYQVPILLLRFIFVFVFFSAAIAKIRNGALAWFVDGNVSDMFARANIWFIGFPLRSFFSSLNIFLVNNLWAAKASALVVFITEILSPMLFFRKFRGPMLVILCFFQIAGTFALYIDFMYSFIILYVFWLPFDGNSPWRIKMSNIIDHKIP